MEKFRWWLAWAGVSVIGLAVILGFLRAFGAIPAGLLSVGGQSELRTLAEIAVVGCMLAAIGFWDQ